MSVEGLIVPVVTPVRRGEIDWESFENLVSSISRAGASIFTSSTTGEGLLLAAEARVEAARRAIEAGATVWAGTATSSVEETVNLARKLVNIGVRGIVVVTPYYYRISQEALYRYYSHVLEHVDAPVIAYTIPKSTCNLLAPETAERLAEEHSNLAGIKVTTGDAGLLLEMIIALRGTQTSVLPGTIALLPLALAHGSRGAVLAAGNLLPRTGSLALGDSMEEWRPLYVKLARAASYIEKGPAPCTVKKALRHAGLLGSDECLGPLGYELVPEPPEWLVEDTREDHS